MSSSSKSSAAASATHLPNKDEIIHAVHSGNLELLKTLLAPEHVNIKDRSGYTLLHVATNLEKTDVAKWLVQHGADLNLHCNGHTVTSLALTKGNFELFQHYLDNGGDCQGRNQLNLLHEAANKQRDDIVQTLIERGVDPNLLNNLHVTPLTVAVSHRNVDICRTLLDNGACANIPDKKGNTPLHLACSLADSGVISVLLDHTECDLKMKNAGDETPLDLYWVGTVSKNTPPEPQLLERLIAAGGVFCTPWNFNLRDKERDNYLAFLKGAALLCKYRVRDLFLNEKPLYTDYVINGYLRNALIVTIKSAVIDFKAQSELDDAEMFALLERIITCDEFVLTENDICSTFYMFDDVQEYQVCKLVRQLFATTPKLRERESPVVDKTAKADEDEKKAEERRDEEQEQDEATAPVPLKSIKAEFTDTDEPNGDEDDEPHKRNSDTMSNHSNSSSSNLISVKKLGASGGSGGGAGSENSNSSPAPLKYEDETVLSSRPHKKLKKH